MVDRIRTSKKATWTLEEDPLYFGLFYLPMTAIVILALVIIPTRMLTNTVQPVDLDARITQERLFTKVSTNSPIFGAQQVLTPDFKKNAALSYSDKRYAYRLSYTNDNKPGDQFTYNPDFYDIAAPLAPVKYNRYVATRFYSNEQVIVHADVLFPFTYQKNG